MSRQGRATHLLQSEVALLDTWGRELRQMFRTTPASEAGDCPATPYLVGSALVTKDYRDVDVRIMLDDHHYDDLAKVVDLDALHLALSLWGQKVTGLPIDCQVQHTTSANEDFNEIRNALGLRRSPLGRKTA